MQESFVVNDESIEENAQKQLSGVPESVHESEQWKRNAEKDSSNIYIFLQFLQNVECSSETQIFVLQIMENIIESYHSELTMLEIMHQLSEVPPERIQHEYILERIGELIGLIARIVSQANQIEEEERISVFRILGDGETEDDTSNIDLPSPSDTETNDMKWAVLRGVVQKMGEPRKDCPEEINTLVSDEFFNGYFGAIFLFSLRALESQPERSIHLLLDCMKYNNSDPTKPVSFADEVVEPFLDIGTYEILFNIATTMEPPHSSAAIDIVTLLVKSTNLRKINEPLSEEEEKPVHLIDNVMEFISRLLQDDAFRQKDENRASLVQLFTNFDRTLMNEDSIRLWLEFTHNVITNDFEMSLDIVQAIVDTLVSRDVAPFADEVATMCNLFMEATLESIGRDSGEAYENMLVMSHTSTARIMHGMLNMLPQVDMSVYADIMGKIVGAIETYTEQAMGSETNVALAFLYMAAKQAIEEKEYRNMKEQHQVLFEHIVPVIDVTLHSLTVSYSSMTTMLDELKDKSTGTVAMEEFGLKFLKALVKYLFFKGNGETDFPELSTYGTEPELVLFIFERFWNDIVEGICRKEAADGMMVLLRKNMLPLNIILESDWPQNFVENYAEFPSKSFVYDIVVGVITGDPRSEATHVFFQSLEEQFASATDLIEVKKLFKILTSVFKSATEFVDCHDWELFYDFFIQVFGGMLMECSSSDIWTVVINFVQQIVISFPKRSPYKSRHPNSLRLFQYFTQIHHNLLSMVLPNLEPIDVDDSLFKSMFRITNFETRQISLMETMDTDLSKQQQLQSDIDMIIPVKKADEGKPDNMWHVFSAIVFSAGKLLNSPFPNYGIMIMYEDTCVLELFGVVMECLSRAGSLVALHAYPNVFKIVTDFVVDVCQYFTDQIIETEEYWEFTVEFLKTTFVGSNSLEMIEKGCRGISYFLNRDEVSPQIISFRQHFVFAVNALLSVPGNHTIGDFIVTYAKLDQAFVIAIGGLIAEYLENPAAKKQFSDGLNHLWDEASDDEEDAKGGIRAFEEKVCPLSLKLDVIVGLNEYFSFDQS